MQGRRTVFGRSDDALSPTAISSASPKTTEEWPSENKEPDTKRSQLVIHQRAGGVVDRGDVVCVERVAQPQRVGRQPDTDAECLIADAEVRRFDDEHQGAPTDY